MENEKAYKTEQKIFFINLKEVSSTVNTETRSHSLKTIIQTTAEVDVAVIPNPPPATNLHPFYATLLHLESRNINNATRVYDLNDVEDAVTAALERSTPSH
eukprot:scaffold8712_cov275-Ochromonas_danica.AAC.1